MIDTTGDEYKVEVGDDDAEAASNDDDGAVQWKRRRRRSPFASSTSSSSYSSSTPIVIVQPSSSSSSSSSVPFFFLTRYLQTLATAILAFSGLICILSSAQSCQFLTVSHTRNYYLYDYDNDTIINDDKTFKNNNNNSDGRSTTFSSSLGIFCNSNDDDDDFSIDPLNDRHDYDTGGNDIMLALSRAFTCISILFSVVLSLLTFGISTTFISPSLTTKLWNGWDGAGGASSLVRQICNISFLSVIIFVCQLPMLFLLDSLRCKKNGGSVGGGGGDGADSNNIVNDDATPSISMMMEISNKCTLGSGSTPLLVSMGMHVALALFTHWKDCPDWREEYELWKLMKKPRMDRSDSGGKEFHNDVTDEEHCRLGTMMTIADDDERQNYHPSSANGDAALLAVVEQQPSRKSWQQQQQQQQPPPTTATTTIVEDEKKMDSQLHLPHGISNVTCNNVKTFSPPTSPSTPPPPLPMSPSEVESNDSILHDLETSLMTTSIISCSSREERKRELSKFLREERLKQGTSEEEELHANRKQLQLQGSVAVSTSGSGYTHGVGGCDNQPTSDAPMDNQHELRTRNASTCPPFVAIHINRNLGEGLESNRAPIASASATDVDDDVRSKPCFNVDELEWPLTAKHFSHDGAMMVPHSINDEHSSPSSMRMTMMKTSSPLTKFSSRMGMVVHDNLHGTNQIIHVVHDDDDEKKDEGGETGSNGNNQNCKFGVEGDSSLTSIRRSMNGAQVPVADGANTSAAALSATVVTPEKTDYDPEIEIYPSDGSLSTLSLASEDYRSTDDEDADNEERYCSDTRETQQDQQPHQEQQPQQEQQNHQRREHQQDQLQQKQVNTMPKKEHYTFLSDGCSSDDSELSAVIAGVQKLNRKTSGKITPLNKRKRRNTGSRNRKSSAGSMSVSSFSSHGSLLDEVIVEESELNSSNEGVAPALIVNTSGGGCGRDGTNHVNESVILGVHTLPSASGFDEVSSLPSSVSPTTATKKKDRRRKKHGNDIGDEDGFGPGFDNASHHSYHSINSEGSSNTEDSNLSRAARGRRSRIATQRQSRIDPEGVYDSSSLFSRPASPDDFPEPHTSRSSGRKVDNPHRGINNRPPPIASINSNSSVDQNAWQARKVRMMRLRMIRGRDDVASMVRGADRGGSSSDGEVDDDFAAAAAVVAPANVINRARQGMILPCSSDEDSI